MLHAVALATRSSVGTMRLSNLLVVPGHKLLMITPFGLPYKQDMWSISSDTSSNRGLGRRAGACPFEPLFVCLFVCLLYICSYVTRVYIYIYHMQKWSTGEGRDWARWGEELGCRRPGGWGAGTVRAWWCGAPWPHMEPHIELHVGSI